MMNFQSFDEYISNKSGVKYRSIKSRAKYGSNKKYLMAPAMLTYF